ncbi:type II secretion system protein [Clostridium thermobutyricum]|uniref:Putative major pilin subunit n=1 Tax=Clostridium thermobutyricum DSM 4928 TaxID=1121339 RepID=A0A1V4SZ07_9CLOT|nr:type II secretion system protein [Clostridium thermobutyricum]OPX50862.1 putative major pilin subunit [Clostridium thermobutyricum DSM 4928]
MKGVIKNKKKKGFTLIEMVAVVAIIGILAAILVPKITGYMKEAKKTGVIDQARKVSQAYETAQMKDKLAKDDNGTVTETPDNIKVATISNETMLSLLDMKTSDLSKELEKIIGVTKADNAVVATDITVKDCIDITNGAEFEVTSDGKLISGSITTK